MDGKKIMLCIPISFSRESIIGGHSMLIVGYDEIELQRI
jgi:C1A family cysteine protease